MNETAYGHGHTDHPHVDTNPWPPVGALGIVCMAFGLALSLKPDFHAPGLGVLCLGALITFIGTIGWWRDLVHEARTNTLPTAHAASEVHKPKQDLMLGFVLFIASEVMFFAAFFGFYFYTRFGAKVWPPADAPIAVESLLLPGIMTVLLVASSFTYTYAESALQRDNRRGFVTGLALTLILGLVFLGTQAFEWTHSELSIRNGVLGSAFYMLTGFHGMHVIVGAIFIAVNFVRSTMGHFSKKDHFAILAAGWYWHFVDVVWLLLFFVVLYVPLYMLKP